MAAFRRLFLVLAVIALAATSVFAQSNPGFSCAVNPSVSNGLRNGGLSELVGDMTVTCTGGQNVQDQVSSINVTLSARVTNRIQTAAMPAGGWPISAAAQVQDMSNNPYKLVVRGLLQADLQTVSFPNLTVPAGTTRSTIRITNIRVAAPAAAAGTSTVVTATISTANSADLPISFAVPIVGVVYPALLFDVTSCSGGSAPSLSFQQCISQPTEGEGALSFGVKFSEQYINGAFRSEDQEKPAADILNQDGSVAVDRDEDVSNGTRLIVKFTNVPDGVTIRVTTREIRGASSLGVQAALVPDANVNGDHGAIDPTVGDTDAECSGSNVFDNNDAQNTLADASASGSTVYAVWEITGRQLPVSTFATVVFGVQVVFDADPGNNSPALSGNTPGGVTGEFAPISTVDRPSTSEAIPRFLTNPVGADVFSIVPCVTNLLFPYVTSGPQYDTGLAFVNTSADDATGDGVPFGTSSQTGPCHLYFFGNMEIGPQDTDPVDPGSLVKYTLNQNAFQEDTAGFEGYIIARCDFQFAHGLAFIVDTTGLFGSQTYLALVIPDRGDNLRLPDPSSTAGAGTGEQLAQ